MEGKMEKRIRHLSETESTQIPQISQKKKPMDSSDESQKMDRDRKGKFLRGHQIARKTQIGTDARRKRLPSAQDRQKAFRRADELMAKLKAEVADTAKNAIALNCIGDILRMQEQMRLAFKLKGEVIDEAAYVKSGVIVPHECLDACTKMTQELRRLMKSVGKDLGEGDDPGTLIDLANRKYRREQL